MGEAKTSAQVRDDAVLSTAVVRAAERLELSQSLLADVLGISEATTSRLFSGNYLFQRRRKREWEFALLFVRLFRSLDAILGGEQSRQWLRSANQGLGGKPIELIRHAEGFIRVLNYLDAYRGRL